MARRALRSLIADERGAVAATYALSLFALIAVAGIGFDYARLATLDTELQDAADQAALAAATQLDGGSTAISRATTQASSLVSNKTLQANDGDADGTAATVATVTFYSTRADAEAGSNGFTDTSKSADAHFVRVAINAREAFYALTPIVDAISSGDINAAAVAGVGSSVCKVPPVFMCNPQESSTNLNPGFDADALKGYGIRLLSGSPNVPGNFGFLDTGAGNATGELAKLLSWDSIPYECAPSTNVGLNPGQKDVVFNAFNTRFDIDTNGANTCPSGGTCSAAANTRKDLVRKSQCGTGGNGWQESSKPYRPTSTSPITSNYPDIMGYPRDICHAVSYDGVCTYNSGTNTAIGSKVWDWDAYFKVNYNLTHAQWKTLTGLSDTPSRYEVYQWEKNNTGYLASQNATAGFKAYSTPVCRPTAPASVPDRRVFSMAIVNCLSQASKIAGNDEVEVKAWADVFLVEPAFNRGSGSAKRTTDDQIYVEVIRATTPGGGSATASQQTRRDKPYLIK